MASPEKTNLQGWKEIAAYVARDVRTVRRWEKSRSLPVRRLPGGGRAVVYAVSAELDRWMLQEPEADSQAAASAAQKHCQASSDPTSTFAELPQTATSQHGFFTLGQRALLASTAVLIVLLLTARLHGRSSVRSSGTQAPALATPVPARYVSKVPSVDDLYLRGLYFCEQRTPDSLGKAKADFLKALSLDPNYAPAWSGLANTYNLLREYSMMPSEEAYPKAKAAAERAIALDPKLPEAHASLAFIDFFWSWNAEAAEREFSIAIALDPQSALAHHWYGSMLTHQTRYAEALQQLELAQHLQPDSTAILSSRAFALGLSGRRDDAVRLLREVSDADHNASSAHQKLAVLSVMAPRTIPQYISQEQLVSVVRHDEEGQAGNADAARAYRKGGETAMWQRLLANESRLHPHEPTYRMAELEAILGRREDALHDLDRLYQRHDWGLIGLGIDLFFSPIRSDPRFTKLATAVGVVPR